MGSNIILPSLFISVCNNNLVVWFRTTERMTAPTSSKEQQGFKPGFECEWIHTVLRLQQIWTGGFSDCSPKSYFYAFNSYTTSRKQPVSSVLLSKLIKSIPVAHCLGTQNLCLQVAIVQLNSIRVLLYLPGALFLCLCPQTCSRTT